MANLTQFTQRNNRTFVKSKFQAIYEKEFHKLLRGDNKTPMHILKDKAEKAAQIICEA